MTATHVEAPSFLLPRTAPISRDQALAALRQCIDEAVIDTNPLSPGATNPSTPLFVQALEWREFFRGRIVGQPQPTGLLDLVDVALTYEYENGWVDACERADYADALGEARAMLLRWAP